MDTCNNVIVATSPARSEYLRVVNAVNELYKSTDFIIHPATLRLEQMLSPGKQSYIFDLYQGNSMTDRPLEKKLNRNDVFFITGFGIAVYKAVPPASSTNPTADGNATLFTYPDANYFVGAAAGKKEAENLMTIWNGNISLKTANTDRLQELLTIHNLVIPEFQYLNAAGSQTAAAFPKFGPTNQDRGIVEMQPHFILDGSQNNTVELNLGSGDRSIIDGSVNAAGAAATTRNTVVLFVNGYKVANGAEKASRWKNASGMW